MKSSQWISLGLPLLLLAGSVCLQAADDEPASESQRPYIGVRLDPNPLPNLLRKHLRLTEDQGLLIYNILLDSPADKAGLEPDDIIIAFQGKPVGQYDEFVDRIRQAGVNANVKLEIIHEGERRTIDLTLESYRQTGEWKYPFREPESTAPRVARRIFRMNPGDPGWQAIPFENLPKDLHRYFQRQETYHIQDGDQDLQITIHGSSSEKDTEIEVHDLKQNKHYRTTIGDIDKLPGAYRDAVKDVLGQSQRRSYEFFFNWPPNNQDNPLGRDRYSLPPYQTPQLKIPDLLEQWEQHNKAIEELNEKIRQMQKQMEQLLQKKSPPQNDVIRPDDEPRKKDESSDSESL
ncbi:MAG: PDZ domain-containing protein [Sedimentisphaerales bacterium]|nr:PDZ domain-containing protein [Sedimentisphaerales bacterium]